MRQFCEEKIDDSLHIPFVQVQIEFCFFWLWFVSNKRMSKVIGGGRYQQDRMKHTSLESMEWITTGNNMINQERESLAAMWTCVEKLHTVQYFTAQLVPSCSATGWTEKNAWVILKSPPNMTMSSTVGSESCIILSKHFAWSSCCAAITTGEVEFTISHQLCSFRIICNKVQGCIPEVRFSPFSLVTKSFNFFTIIRWFVYHGSHPFLSCLNNLVGVHASVWCCTLQFHGKAKFLQMPSFGNAHSSQVESLMKCCSFGWAWHQSVQQRWEESF